jgi:hypothetical protein
MDLTTFRLSRGITAMLVMQGISSHADRLLAWALAQSKARLNAEVDRVRLGRVLFDPVVRLVDSDAVAMPAEGCPATYLHHACTLMAGHEDRHEERHRDGRLLCAWVGGNTKWL